MTTSELYHGIAHSCHSVTCDIIGLVGLFPNFGSVKRSVPTQEVFQQTEILREYVEHCLVYIVLKEAMFLVDKC